MTEDVFCLLPGFDWSVFFVVVVVFFMLAEAHLVLLVLLVRFSPNRPSGRLGR